MAAGCYWLTPHDGLPQHYSSLPSSPQPPNGSHNGWLSHRNCLKGIFLLFSDSLSDEVIVHPIFLLTVMLIQNFAFR